VATHFSTIGLAVYTDPELLDLVERAMANAERFPTPHGTYLRWADPSGAELWIQLNAENELIGVNPHFGGLSRVRVLLTHRLDTGSPSILDGRFHGWADPEKAEAETEQSGAYPFLFDAPDAVCHAELALPAEVDIQVAAFAHDVQVYANAKAFDAAQTGDAWETSQTFIPTGLMKGGDGELRAEAAFTGHVQRSERRTNQLTATDFVWCLVSSTGGTFDIVADPELLPKPPAAGSVITGTFWLTGRIGACAPVSKQPTQLQASDGWKRRGKVQQW
jgi:hypothetical protein